MSTSDLGANSVRLAVRIILDHLDRTLTKQIRLRFAPSAGMVLTIPNISSVAIPNQLLRQTIYYVTGWVLSCLYDESKLDTEISPPARYFYCEADVDFSSSPGAQASV
jgi:hypothetical protein